MEARSLPYSSSKRSPSKIANIRGSVLGHRTHEEDLLHQYQSQLGSPSSSNHTSIANPPTFANPFYNRQAVHSVLDQLPSFDAPSSTLPNIRGSIFSNTPLDPTQADPNRGSSMSVRKHYSNSPKPPHSIASIKSMSKVKVPPIATGRVPIVKRGEKEEDYQVFTGEKTHKPKRSVDLVEKFLKQKIKRQKQKVLAEKAQSNNQSIRRSETQRNNPLRLQADQANKTIAVDASHRLLEIKELKVRTILRQRREEDLMRQLTDEKMRNNQLAEQLKELQRALEYMKDMNRKLLNDLEAIYKQQQSSPSDRESLASHNISPQVSRPSFIPGTPGSLDLLSGGSGSFKPRPQNSQFHSLYHQLYVSDMKDEIRKMQKENEKLNLKQKTHEKEVSGLKKEHNKLEQTIRRYRKMVLDMNQKTGSPKNQRTLNKDPGRTSLIIQTSKLTSELVEDAPHYPRDQTLGETEAGGLKGYDSGEEIDTARQRQKRVGRLVNLVQSSLDSDYSRLSQFGKHNQSYGSLKGAALLSTGGIDVSKIEKLLKAVGTIMASRTMIDVSLKALAQLKEITHAMNAIFYIYDQKTCFALFQKPRSRKLAAILQDAKRGATASSNATRNVTQMRSRSNSPLGTPSVTESRIEKARSHGQKYMVDGQWVDILTDVETQMGEPMFETPADTRYGLRASDAMCFGIPAPRHSGDMWFTVQVEKKKSKSKKGGKSFTSVDELFLKLFTTAFSFKLAAVQAEIELYERSELVNRTLHLCQQISAQKTHQQLIWKMRQTLPEYFGFQDVGVLIYDEKKKDLFTISDTSMERESTPSEHVETPLPQDRDSPLPRITITDKSSHFAQTKTLQMQKEKKLKELALDFGQIITFPCTLGVTGFVFQRPQRVYICNQVQKESKFNSDIDNVSSITDVRNFMIGTVHRESDNQPIGVLQFMNKRDGTDVTQEQADHFKRLRVFLGACCQNCNLMNSTQNLTAGVKQVMENINSEWNLEEGGNLATENILKAHQLEQIIMGMKDTMNESQAAKDELLKAMKR